MKFFVSNCGLIDGDDVKSNAFLHLVQSADGEEEKVLIEDFKREYPHSSAYLVTKFNEEGEVLDG